MDTQRFIVVDGKRLPLKANGLSDGYNLFWQARGKLRYLYTKFRGRGLSCGTADPKEAVRFVDHKRKEWEQTEEGIPVGKLKINDLLNVYITHLESRNLSRGDYSPKTAKFTEAVLKAHVRPFFGEIAVSQLIKLPNKQAAYRAKRTKELCAKMRKPADKVQYTIDHELGYVRSAYNRAARQHLIPKSIIPVFDIDKANSTKGTRQGMFDDDQFNKLMEALPAHVAPMLAFCNTVAVRKKEATFIHRKEVNWDPADKHHRVVRLRAEETKAGKERFVGIPLQPAYARRFEASRLAS